MEQELEENDNKQEQQDEKKGEEEKDKAMKGMELEVGWRRTRRVAERSSGSGEIDDGGVGEEK